MLSSGDPPLGLILESPFNNIVDAAFQHPFAFVSPSVSVLRCFDSQNSSHLWVVVGASVARLCLCFCCQAVPVLLLPGCACASVARLCLCFCCQAVLVLLLPVCACASVARLCLCFCCQSVPVLLLPVHVCFCCQPVSVPLLPVHVCFCYQSVSVLLLPVHACASVARRICASVAGQSPCICCQSVSVILLPVCLCFCCQAVISKAAHFIYCDSVSPQGSCWSSLGFVCPFAQRAVMLCSLWTVSWTVISPPPTPPSCPSILSLHSEVVITVLKMRILELCLKGILELLKWVVLELC